MQKQSEGKVALLSKSEIGSYVHDALEMEKRGFVLNKIAIECRRQAEKILKKANEEVDASNKKLMNAHLDRENTKKVQEQAVDAEVKKLPEKPDLRYTDCWSDILKVVLCSGIVTTLILNGFAELVWDNNMVQEVSENKIFLYQILLPTIVGCIVGIIAGCLKNSSWKALDRKYNAEQIERYERWTQVGKERIEQVSKTYEEKLILIDQTILNYEHELHNAQKTLDQVRIQSNALQKLADQYEKKSQEITIIAQNFYERFNIIPPDYRYMDCIMDLDHLFRNGLADTMKEAVNMYNERVFRGQILRGMEQIYSRLGSLGTSMSHIESTLIGIQSNVSFMSQDVYQMTEKMNHISERQDKVLSESKASRYAAEAIQKSTEKMNWYIEQYRLETL